MTICELYHFDFEGGPDYRYTSAEVDISYGGHTWEAVKIDRGRPPSKMVGESSRSTLDMEMDGIDTDVVREWDGAGPSREVRVTIYVASRADIAGTIMQVFPGVVQSISGRGKRITITAALRTTGAEKTGPRGHFSTRCRHALYGPGCKADAGTFSEFATVTAGDPVEATVQVTISAELAEDYFVGGAFFAAGLNAARRIISQEGPVSLGGGDYRYVLGLHYWIDGLTSGTVLVAPGCDRTFFTCSDRFLNFENFGGFQDLNKVLQSPFRYGYRYKDPRGES